MTLRFAFDRLLDLFGHGRGLETQRIVRHPHHASKPILQGRRSAAGSRSRTIRPVRFRMRRTPQSLPLPS